MIENYKNEWSDPKYKNIFADTSIVCKYTEIKNSTLGEYSRLKTHCEFRNSILGDYSYLNSFSTVNTADIGRFVSIGPGVFIGLWDHNQWVSTHPFYLNELCGGFIKGFKNFERDSVRVKIGNDVWIGANVTIIKGVTVGDGAIIGSGALVTHDVPAYAVVVGIPAKVLRYRFSEEDIKYLLGLKWWDFKKTVLQEMVDKGLWDSLDKIKTYCEEVKKQNVSLYN